MRRHAWWLTFLVAACSSEASTESELATPTPAPPVLSTPTLPEVDSAQPTEPGPFGLEYDPVAKRLIIPETGPPQPRPLTPNTKLGADGLLRDEQVGVILEASFVHRDLGAPPPAPELDKAGLVAAAKATAPNLTITVTALGRMRILFASRSFPLPFLAELRARFDKFGHLAVWPGLAKYRIVPPGALKTAIGERRVDVMPLVSGTKVRSGTGKRLEIPTRTVTLESPMGTLTLDVATVPESGLGGPLLCRALVEILHIDPATPECKPEEVPLHATVDWKNGGGFELEVSSVERRTDVAPGEILVPPPNAETTDEPLPTTTGIALFTREELRAFRTKAVEAPRSPEAPIEGVVADNQHDYQLMLFIDGIPVLTVPPLDRRLLLGFVPGRYSAQWRSFLGDATFPAEVVDIPAVLFSKPPPAPPASSTDP
jgi:hypothetical protein